MRPNILAGLLGAASVPVNITLPSFTGTLTDGQIVTYVPGTWSGGPSLTHQWFSDGVALVGETGATLNLTGLGENKVSVGETATNATGTSTATSAEKYVFVNDAARALVARITVEPETYWKRAYDAVYSVSGFTTALGKLTQFAMFSGPNAQAALLDWKAARSITLNGGMTHTPAQGFKSDGTTGYLDSGILLSSASPLAQNDASLSAYVLSGSGSDQGAVIGINTTNDRFRLNPLTSGGTALACRINQASTNTIANTNSTGMYSVVRTAAGAGEVFRNGASLGTFTVASSGLQVANVLYFRNSTATYAHLSTTLSAGGFGQALTAADNAILQEAVETFNTLATPRNFGIVFAGQSLMNRLFLDQASATPGDTGTHGSGDGTVGSNAIDRVFIPELQAYLDAQYTDGRPNQIWVINTSVSGSNLLTLPGQNGWWNQNTVSAGLYAINDRDDVDDLNTLVALSGGTFDGGFLRFWGHGEANAAGNISQSDYILSFCGAAYNAGLVAYFRAGDSGTTPIIISTLGRNSTEADASIKAVRDAQTEAAANVTAAYLGPETADLVRTASGDWHPVSFGISANGFDRAAHFHARMAATVFGCTAVKYKGPEVASAASVLSTTTTVTLVYPAGCGGTDFTPVSGIEGFKVYDNGVERAISSAIRVNATTILLTHAAVSGTRTVQYLPIQGAISLNNMVVDNFAGIPMPLRMSTLLTAT